MLAVLAILSFANAQEVVTITGIVDGDTKGYDKVFVYGEGLATDSAKIINGKFTLTVRFTKPRVVLMYDQYSAKMKGGYMPIQILMDRPGKITIESIDITKGLRSGKVTGMKSAADFFEFNQQLIAAKTEIGKRLGAKYGGKYIMENDPQRPAYDHDYDSINAVIMPPVYRSIVEKNPNSYAALCELQGMGRNDLPTEDLEALFNKLSPDLKKMPEGIALADYLVGAKNSAVGSKVKDFTLSTPEDRPLELSSLKGKYVLIDFWASWCGPCKKSFPHLKEIYQKYKSDNFEIYSISIDKDKASWLKELKIQQLPWLQTLDTKNVAASGFAVNAVPTAYLIDPDGKIVMKEIGFSPDGTSPMEKKIEELLSAK